MTKEQVKANKYDLSASRYRQIEQDEVFHEEPKVTMERMLRLEQAMTEAIQELQSSVKFEPDSEAMSAQDGKE